MSRNPLKRLSMALKFSTNGSAAVSSSNPPPTIPETHTLSEFLTSAKTNYLRDIKDASVGGGEWTVSMGNEAGDLDSLASSIAFAWLNATTKFTEKSVPLIQTAKDDFKLREENLYAFSLAGITNPLESLVSITDIGNDAPFPSHKFALVDHNRLGGRFTTENPSAEVVAVVDHHEDEGLYKGTAEPRIIGKAGSCASHVGLLLRGADNVPAELATLLLCAILIDTGGLKANGKALPVDYEAATALIPMSTYASEVDPTSYSGDKLADAPAIKTLTAALSSKKEDVSRLSAYDLLRRDYKEYSHPLQWAPDQPTIKAGLSTVPTGVASWATKGKLLEASEQWMKLRGLTVLGVLTSFRDEKKFTKNGRGKHRREQIWIIRGDANVVGVDALAERLWEGLKASDDLKLKKHKKFELVPKKERKEKEKGIRWKGYKQGNADATRKVTAPLVKNILEGSPEVTKEAEDQEAPQLETADVVETEVRTSQTEVRASQQTDSVAYGGLAEEPRKSE
ncbi:DHH phosphoesterase [Pleurotus eryngii]|uniref:DHH phosphoesterase n=1 Tax=Pleurotus eryngii TaxID=5323 RepID=A0A9P5ZPE2_PLEER|nr:DHH phosphoesterase [Pleurotus eryngii]